MEEGVPPTHSPLPLPPRPPPNPSSTAIVPFASRSTYVVQAPKDQIFRVPPPENAEKVEHYRNLLKNKKNTPACYTHLVKVLVIVLVIAAVSLLAYLIAYLVVGPKDPTFTLERLVTVKKSGGGHEYALTMKAANPSKKMSYYFEKGDSGSAALSHKDDKLASGRSPAFTVINQKSEVFKLVFEGSRKVELPSVVEKSFKGSKDVVSLVVSVELPVRSSVGGIRFSAKKMDLECDVKVKNLAKETKIVSQKCEAKFQ